MKRKLSVTVRWEWKATDQVKLCGSLKWMLDPPSLTPNTTFGKAVFGFLGVFSFLFPFSFFYLGTSAQISLNSERIWLVCWWPSVWCSKPEARSWIYIIGIGFDSIPCWSKVHNIKDRCKNRYRDYTKCQMDLLYPEKLWDKIWRFSCANKYW